jgi:CRISPR system Cascade subunit CasA
MNATPLFNLFNEPWIPVLNASGDLEELGLRELFARAHDLKELRDPMPILEFGLYRLLVAITLDVFRPSGLADLESLLSKGAFDQDAIDSYYGKFGALFDLFHPTHPFYQVAGMKDEELKPLAGLLPPIASGSNVTHFHHAHEEMFRVSPAAAARILCTVPPFMTAGGSGLSPSINGAPPWYTLVGGKNLFETILFNCPVVETQYDLPAWRREKPVGKNEEFIKTGILGAFTWQPRRIQLIPEEGGTCVMTGHQTPVLVGKMKFVAGAKARVTTWKDPNTPYRTTDKGVFPLRPQEEKEPWRDTGPIALLREKDFVTSGSNPTRYERPAIITQYTELQQGYLMNASAQVALTMYGLCTDGKMKMYEWHREILTVPLSLAVSSRMTTISQQAMETADSVAYEIRRALKIAYPRSGKGNNNANQTLITRAQQEYWSLLREPFNQLLYALARLPVNAEDRELENEVIPWRQVVRQTAIRVFQKIISDLDTDADALQRSVAAERAFFSGLKKHVPIGGEK